MQVDPIAGARAGEKRVAGGHGFSLTANELMQLGLFRVGYVTGVSSAGRGTEIVVHGANGMPIATVDSIEQALDLAEHLGLALVPVH
jgi:hypothetical protein